MANIMPNRTLSRHIEDRLSSQMEIKNTGTPQSLPSSRLRRISSHLFQNSLLRSALILIWRDLPDTTLPLYLTGSPVSTYSTHASMAVECSRCATQDGLVSHSTAKRTEKKEDLPHLKECSGTHQTVTQASVARGRHSPAHSKRHCPKRGIRSSRTRSR